MFYHIGQPTTLLNEVRSGLYLDEGWTHINNVWYKGYSIDCTLSDNIDKILTGYKPRGIWCVIQALGNEYQVYHPSTRCFPEYVDDYNRSSLIGTEIAPTEKFTPKFYDTHADIQKTVTALKEYMRSNIIDFHTYNNSEMNIWCTGGVDSASIVAMYEHAQVPYNIYIARPKNVFLGIRNYEGSVTEYSSELTEYIQPKYWGYELLSRFDKPITLATGFYGDEYLCRGPQQLIYLASSIGKHIVDVMDKNQYMVKYLHKCLKQNITHNTLKFQSIDKIEAKERIFSDIALDYQIWHLNSVTTFCPYYDERILNEVLKLDTEVLLEQALTANLQKELINQTFPDVNLLVDTYKNTMDGRVNFFKNIDKVKLSFCKQIIEV